MKKVSLCARMPATDYQGSSAAFTNIGRPVQGIRRDQLYAMDGSPTSPEQDLDFFQKQVADRFLDLASVGPDDLLSLSWVHKLLNSFLSCQEDFKLVLISHKSQISRPPLDRLVADYSERSVKALDVCNAIRDGIEQLRQWQKLLEIVLSALDNCNNQKTLGEGQFRRAKKALIDLAICMLDEKDSHTSALAHRNRSFGRNNASKDPRSLGHFRSLSWSVSRSWSAARQLQSIGNNLAAPKATELLTTNGLAVPVFTMNMVLLFVMWALVAAIPCQDRGLQVHFSLPRNFPWASPILQLHDRIVEESKKRDRRNSCGLLKEINQIEKCTRLMNDLADSAQFPLAEEKEAELRQRVQELTTVCDTLRTGLDSLERQVREVFHRIVRSRTEGLDSLGRANHSE